MRRLCSIQIAFVLLAWFFAFEHPLLESEDKVLVKGFVGPFSSERVCNAERENLVSIPFPGLKVSACVERKEA